MENLQRKTKAELIEMVTSKIQQERNERNETSIADFTSYLKNYISGFQRGMLSKAEICSAIDLVKEYFDLEERKDEED